MICIAERFQRQSVIGDLGISKCLAEGYRFFCLLGSGIHRVLQLAGDFWRLDAYLNAYLNAYLTAFKRLKIYLREALVHHIDVPVAS